MKFNLMLYYMSVFKLNYLLITCLFFLLYFLQTDSSFGSKPIIQKISKIQGWETIKIFDKKQNLLGR